MTPKTRTVMYRVTAGAVATGTVAASVMGASCAAALTDSAVLLPNDTRASRLFTPLATPDNTARTPSLLVAVGTAYAAQIKAHIYTYRQSDERGVRHC